jgi:hypothetical protein
MKVEDQIMVANEQGVDRVLGTSLQRLCRVYGIRITLLEASRYLPAARHEVVALWVVIRA